MFPLVREAVASVVPVERLRYIAFSHVEADECGSLNEWLAVAPHSSPLCGTVAAMVSISDLTGRLARSPMLKLYRSENTWCGGSIRRTCRTRGSAATSWRRVRGRSSAAICLRKAVLTTRPSRSRTSSDRAKLSAGRWTTFRTRRMPERC
jgi:hypothetical protein